MIFKTTMAVLLGAVLTAPAEWAAGGPPSPEPPFKLLFFSPQDLADTWDSASARQLAGRTIRLRFFFGGSTIYAVTAKPQPSKGR